MLKRAVPSPAIVTARCVVAPVAWITPLPGSATMRLRLLIPMTLMFRCCPDQTQAPRTTEPAIVIVAAWTPSPGHRRRSGVAAERSAAFPMERLASPGNGWSAKPPRVNSSVPVPAVRRTGARPVP